MISIISLVELGGGLTLALPASRDGPLAALAFSLRLLKQFVS